MTVAPSVEHLICNLVDSTALSIFLESTSFPNRERLRGQVCHALYLRRACCRSGRPTRQARRLSRSSGPLATLPELTAFVLSLPHSGSVGVKLSDVSDSEKVSRHREDHTKPQALSVIVSSLLFHFSVSFSHVVVGRMGPALCSGWLEIFSHTKGAPGLRAPRAEKSTYVVCVGALVDCVLTPSSSDQLSPPAACGISESSWSLKALSRIRSGSVFFSKFENSFLNLEE